MKQEKGGHLPERAQVAASPGKGHRLANSQGMGGSIRCHTQGLPTTPGPPSPPLAWPPTRPPCSRLPASVQGGRLKYPAIHLERVFHSPHCTHGLISQRFMGLPQGAGTGWSWQGIPVGPAWEKRGQSSSQHRNTSLLRLQPQDARGHRRPEGGLCSLAGPAAAPRPR